MSYGSESRERFRHLTIRLSLVERAIIDEGAARAGLTAGSYARQVLLGAPVPRQVRRPPVEARELVRLLGELGHIGSNLNQIARAGNSGEQIDVIDLANAERAILVMRDAVLTALGRPP